MPQAIIKWIFFDSFSRTQSNPITTEEAQMAIFKMRMQDTNRFFIWTQGWENWQNLKAYLESKQKVFATSFSHYSDLDEETKKVEVLEVLEMKPAEIKVEEEVTKSFSRSITKSFSAVSLHEETMAKEIHIDNHKFDGDDLKIDQVAKPKIDFKKIRQKMTLETRADRHEVKIELLLISSKGKTFRSKSKNISLTGSLLEDTIPFDYADVTFDVVVINKYPCEPKYQRVSVKGKTVGEGLTQRIYFIDMTPQQKMTLQKLLEHYMEIQSKMRKSAS